MTRLRLFRFALRSGLIFLSGLLTACGQAIDESNGTPADAQACADAKAVLVPGTGHYSREIPTASPQAQAYFDQGLRLTYSYYFPEALASFNAALCFDPDNAMVHWGRALAIAPNPNSRYGGAPDDPEGLGKAAIAQAREKATSLAPVEQALIDTLAVLFDTQTYPEQAQRSQAFIDATQKLLADYPQDLEAAFLAADAIMLASPWQYFSPEDGSPVGMGAEAMRILETGIERHSQHPGLNHLHIHLMENSHQPERAEASADRLESLTPKAGHMVHMPGHIYMRTGRYADAIATNERSLAADRYFVEQWGERPLPGGLTYGLSARVHGPHARNFIQWGSLLQGDSQRAIAEAKAMAQGVSQEQLNRGRSLRTVAAYWMTLKVFGRWEEILALPAPAESQPYLKGIYHLARGSALLAREDVAGAEAELTALKQVAQNDTLPNQRAAVNRAADLMAIAQAVLSGEIAAAKGEQRQAIEHFQTAVSAQDRLRYMEPPDWLQSTRLYLGQTYLDAGQYAQAEAVFRKDLQALQNNGWALYGLVQSLKGQGKMGAAAAAQARFEEAWVNADVDLSAAHF